MAAYYLGPPRSQTIEWRRPACSRACRQVREQPAALQQPTHRRIPSIRSRAGSLSPHPPAPRALASRSARGGCGSHHPARMRCRAPTTSDGREERPARHAGRGPERVLDSTRLRWTRLDSTRLRWTRLDSTRLDSTPLAVGWTRLDWTASDWTRPHQTGLDWTGFGPLAVPYRWTGADRGPPSQPRPGAPWSAECGRALRHQREHAVPHLTPHRAALPLESRESTPTQPPR